ncbi:MAG: CinA family protein, partial [Oscillospiraceae bacterium]|nr:CinA family protein [Oscillospiraceae bacterium]
MATGVRKNLAADYAVSVTGLAGPDGDEFGNPVGTVFVGFADENGADVRKFQFPGNREDVRNQAICAALAFVLEKI